MIRFISFYLIVLFILTSSQHASSQHIIENEKIVMLNDGEDYNSLERLLSGNSWNIVRKLSQSREIYLLKNTNSRNSSRLTDLSIFKYVTNNVEISIRNNPNDTLYERQWDLRKMGIEKAWEYTTGGFTTEGDEIVIAVLDDGFILNQPDLEGSFYSNPHDQPGDMNNDGCPGICGVDDDGDGLIDEDRFGREPGHPNYDNSFSVDDDENGYKDDTNGLNPKSGTDIHPLKSHGTSVCGIIGAQTNNTTGVAGINWNVKILPLSGGLSVPDVIESYEYINEMRRQYNESNGERGAFIVTCNYSLGIDEAFPEEFPIWCGLYDNMGKNGIINVSAATNDNINVDVTGDIPTLCPSKYLISTTATDIDDNFAENGFGRENIDLAAPGKNSFTVDPISSDGFSTFSGNSAASPHVAGAIGLLYSIPCPEFVQYFKNNPSKVDSLAEIIISSTDKLEALSGLVRSDGRLNVFNAMVNLNKFCGGDTDALTIESAFPNPVEDLLYFTFKADPLEKIYVEIYNILGQKIFSESIDYTLYADPQSTVNTATLLPGVYFLSLNQGKKRTAIKFIKA